MAEQFNYLDFPIGSHLEEICSNLKNSPTHCLVLTAETAAGKSTVLPLALLDAFKGKIVMSEPRRLAALGVANRLAEELNEDCGNTVGYKVHLESKVSSKTRLEVLTEGILVRNLQSDPALEEINVVVIDEFHERSINTDLALAFIKEALELRDDLYVIVMSATMDSRKVVEYLGEGTPCINVPGRNFEVEVEYEDKASVVSTILREADNTKGNILVFLPGISDIRRCEEELKEALADSTEYEIHVLHSSITLEQQKKAISKNNTKQRIILSSAIAETSLTVPGVTVVIDSGLARVNRTNLSTGMETLVTEVESEFSAEQRKGRAGRQQKGRCVRLWNEFDPRKKVFEPEILRSDLSELVLECAERGIYNLESIKWLDPPAKSSWNASVEMLKMLKFIKDDARITEKGRAGLRMGLSPRLAALALEGKANGLKYDNLILKYSAYSQSHNEIQKRFLADLNNRLEKIDISKIKEDCSIIKKEKLLILAGFPDRVAKRITSAGAEKNEYQFYGGRKAIIVNDKHDNSEWICAPEVLAGTNEGRIFDYEAIPLEEIKPWIIEKAVREEKSYFENGKLLKVENLCFGKIVLESKKLIPSEEDFKWAWINELKEKGFEILPMDDKTERFLTRVKFYKQQKESAFNEKLFEQELIESSEQWLLPFITNPKLTAAEVYEGLRWYLNGAEIEEAVPEQLKLTNGSKVRVKYELQNSPEDKSKLIIRPVIEVIIQRMFGVFETPEICGMKVLLKLLSPASRSLQITDDLAGFWNGSWIEICKEMKGRYPKHNWDYKQFIE